LTNLYAISHQPDEPLWQDYRHFTSSQLPCSTRHWLLDKGSLTQRLIKASHGQFRVQVLKQHWRQPLLSERSILDMAPREIAIIREVLLLCHNQPWVYARSVMPASSLNGRLRRLRKFDDSSLGEMLFREPSMRRHPFQLALIDGQSPHLPAQIQQPQTLWGRRSRFDLTGKPIMVSEIFLPAFTA
jgi:chorismate--pyruvate lyase